MTKVLLVEDDELMLRLYERALRLHQYEVTAVLGGKEALQKAQTMPFDVVLLDIMMPEMNGYEVLEALKKDPRLEQIPVIMLTNLTGQEDKEEAKNKGAAYYIVKSEHEPDDIGPIIDSVLGTKNA